METAIRSYQKVVSEEFTAFIDVKFNFTPDPAQCSGGQSKGLRRTLNPLKVRKVRRMPGGGCVIFTGKGDVSKRYAKEPRGEILKRIKAAKALRSKFAHLVQESPA